MRQEILSGIRHESQFGKLKAHLENFPDLSIITEDYVAAAKFFNLCRAKGVQGSNTDFLICAVAVRNKFAIYSTDKDFDWFSKYIPIILYRSETPQPLHNRLIDPSSVNPRDGGQGDAPVSFRANRSRTS